MPVLYYIINSRKKYIKILIKSVLSLLNDINEQPNSHLLISLFDKLLRHII